MTARGVLDWAGSGLALLTGTPEAPVFPRRDYAGRLRSLLDETERAAATALGPPLELGMDLFSARAAELGLSRQGRTSCNGAARMLRCADGWLAVNLARQDDRDTVAAWVGGPYGEDPWAALARIAPGRSASDLAETGQALGIPASVVGSRDDIQWHARSAGAGPGPRAVRMASGGRRGGRPLVVDLSSLWAGPLCGQLLTRAGARVIKVESIRRPDGARAGPGAFYDRLHAGQEAVALDFAAADGRARLADLVARADVVIESTRPRALEQLGIDLEAAFRANRSLVWVSITACGRDGPWRNHVGFGDDAAAAGGLIAHDGAGDPLFAGDALADPAAGLMAAWGAFEALAAGGGVLVDTALREAAAWVAEADPLDLAEPSEVVAHEGGWRVRVDGAEAPLAPPCPPPVTAVAPALGAHTAAVLAELA